MLGNSQLILVWASKSFGTKTFQSLGEIFLSQLKSVAHFESVDDFHGRWANFWKGWSQSEVRDSRGREGSSNKSRATIQAVPERNFPSHPESGGVHALPGFLFTWEMQDDPIRKRNSLWMSVAWLCVFLNSCWLCDPFPFFSPQYLGSGVQFLVFNKRTPDCQGGNPGVLQLKPGSRQVLWFSVQKLSILSKT